jgi:hypothetical protein
VSKEIRSLISEIKQQILDLEKAVEELEKKIAAGIAPDQADAGFLD